MALWEAMTYQSHMESHTSTRIELWASDAGCHVGRLQEGAFMPKSEGCPSGMGSSGQGCTESSHRLVTFGL